MFKYSWIRWFFTLLFSLGLVGTIALTGPDHPAHAQVHTNADVSAAIQYAESHWNCGDATCSFTVRRGDSQPNFMCAEFVARALAAEGLVPGLDSSSPQSRFGSYTASNGKRYDLLWASSNNAGGDGRGIIGLEDYLLNTGIGTDIGDNPSHAAPGDVVFVRANPNHTSIIVDTSHGPVVDEHNLAYQHLDYNSATNARYFYHYAGRTIIHIHGNTTHRVPASQLVFRDYLGIIYSIDIQGPNQNNTITNSGCRQTPYIQNVVYNMWWSTRTYVYLYRDSSCHNYYGYLYFASDGATYRCLEDRSPYPDYDCRL